MVYPENPDSSANPDRPETPESIRPDGAVEPRAPRQPASQDDLREFPPSSAGCVRIRSLLRDFVDGELAREERSDVESHAHECRSCALALSRAESEWLQISSAFGEVDRTGMVPSADFTSVVMTRVREAAAAQPPVGFTKRVMARVREEILADSVGQPRVRPLLLLTAAAMVLVALGAFWAFDPLQPTVMEVVSADHAARIRGGVSVPLVSQDQFTASEIQPGDEFATKADGGFEMNWRVADDAITLRAEEETRLRMGAAREGGPPSVSLHDGELSVATETEMRLTFRDGSRVELTGGDYTMSSEETVSEDATPGVRVKVTVRKGRARIVRGSNQMIIPMGSEGRYDQQSPMERYDAPTDELVVNSGRRGRDRKPNRPRAKPKREVYFGQILDPRDRPVAFASVSVVTVDGIQSLRTDELGRFRLAEHAQWVGQFVIVRALPPATRRDLAPLWAEAMFIRESNAGDQGPRRFRLRPSREIAGRVLHQSSARAIPGMHLQPCRIDEVTGRTVPIGPLVEVDGNGDFVVHGLPAESSPHETYLLIAVAEGVRPRVIWSGSYVRPDDQVLRLSVLEAERQLVFGFDPDTTVDLLYAVPGLSLGSATLVRRVRTDASGSLELNLSEPVYLLDEKSPPQRLIRKPSGELDKGGSPGSLNLVRAGTLVSDQLVWAHLEDLPKIARLPRTGVGLTVFESRSGLTSSDTWLFLRPSVGGNASSIFLGVFDGSEPLRCGDQLEGELLARNPQGWVGRRPLKVKGGYRSEQIAVHRPGRIRWIGGRSGLITLHRVSGGEEPVVVVRDCRDPEWTLVPGRYRFDQRFLEITSDSVQVLK